MSAEAGGHEAVAQAGHRAEDRNVLSDPALEISERRR